MILLQNLAIRQHDKSNENPQLELNKFSEDEKLEFMQIFSMFDTDGSGAIGKNELKQAMKRIGVDATEGEIDELIEEVRLKNYK